MIRLKNVSKFLSNNDEPVLDGVNINISQGDYVCITGHPGQARKTLIRLIAGVTLPSAGEIYIDGVDAFMYSFNDLAKLRREKFACMLLDMELDENLSVKDNVKLPLVYAGRDKKKKEELTNHALNILGMQKLANEKVARLNDWQKNKVSLARAIVTSPRVLIIEEPCRNLDPNKIVEVEGLLSALNGEGITIIISSNQSYYQEKARTIYTISGREVVETKKLKPVKKEQGAALKKPRKKKAKEEKVEETEQSDAEIEVSDKSAELFETEKQMSFDMLSEDEALKLKGEKKTRKPRKGAKQKGEEQHEN